MFDTKVPKTKLNVSQSHTIPKEYINIYCILCVFMCFYVYCGKQYTKTYLIVTGNLEYHHHTQKLHVFQKIDLFGFNSGDDSQPSTNCLISPPIFGKLLNLRVFQIQTKWF